MSHFSPSMLLGVALGAAVPAIMRAMKRRAELVEEEREFLRFSSGGVSKALGFWGGLAIGLSGGFYLGLKLHNKMVRLKKMHDAWTVDLDDDSGSEDNSNS